MNRLSFMHFLTLVLGLALFAACGENPAPSASPEAADAEVVEGDTTPLSGPGTFHLAVEGMS